MTEVVKLAQRLQKQDEEKPQVLENEKVNEPKIKKQGENIFQLPPETFQLPPDMKMGYEVTPGRVVCIVYKKRGENKYIYGASIYRRGPENWSVKEAKRRIRQTALGRSVKNPVVVELPAEIQPLEVFKELRKRLHKHGVCGSKIPSTQITAPSSWCGSSWCGN